MNTGNDRDPPDAPGVPDAQDPLERALDRALARSHAAPVLPADFRRRLQAAIARSPLDDHAALRAAIEREHTEQQRDLRRGYVRLSQRALGTLIGSAFAAGIVIMLALPWITEHFGRNGVFALPAIGVAIGLAISARAWWQRSSLAQLLR
jgi:hypothetical protein